MSVAKYQLIMNRGLEGGGEPDITRGTLEGDIMPGKITFFRLQGNADSVLQSYIAQGEILPVATQSFVIETYGSELDGNPPLFLDGIGIHDALDLTATNTTS